MKSQTSQALVRRLKRRHLLLALAAAGLAPSARAEPAAATLQEPAIDPHRPIIDPHHHLRAFRGAGDGRRPYGLSDLLSDIDNSGHNVTQTVFIECGVMYRPDGPAELRSLGETAYVRGVAELSASGRYGPRRVAAGIVAKVDLRTGDRAKGLLEAHIAAAGGRLRGVRGSIAWDAYPPLAAMGLNKDLLSDAAFRRGFAALSPMGLTFDVWLFHPQLGALADLADAFPDTTMVLNHLGSPLGVGPYAGHDHEVFAAWRASMADLARRPNVQVKLGGLGPFWTPPATPLGSAQLARQWAPYIETTIALFGPERCMFESNYPANAGVSSYRVLWNAFKRVTAPYAESEKTALYSETARRVYRLPSFV